MTVSGRGRTRLNAAREAQGMPRGITPGTDTTLVVRGVVVAVDTTGNRLKVAVNGGAGSWVAAVPWFDYTSALGRPVHCLRNPLKGGRLELVFGPTLALASTPDEDDVPEVPPAAPPSTVTRTVTVTPDWSGTYNAYRSAWDRWNTDRPEYGGRSTLYQGQPSWYTPHGPFTGLAVFGNQIVNLSAITITDMQLTLRGADLNEASYPAMTLQAATNGTQPSGAPTVAGSTFTGDADRNSVVTVTVPSALYAGFAAGTYKGIATVGSLYNAVRGTSAADGMALRITYTTAN